MFKAVAEGVFTQDKMRLFRDAASTITTKRDKGPTQAYTRDAFHWTGKVPAVHLLLQIVGAEALEHGSTLCGQAQGVDDIPDLSDFCFCRRGWVGHQAQQLP